MDKLVYSKYWKVRCAVADFGRDKDLDILVHDDSTIIKMTVGEFKMVKDLEILKNDDNDTVRLLALHSLHSLKVEKKFKLNLFIIRSLSGKILYVFSYNRYNHCFTTVDSKTMHRFFIDDNEIILYNIKYQFANKDKIEEPFELKYHINFEEYY